MTTSNQPFDINSISITLSDDTMISSGAGTYTFAGAAASPTYNWSTGTHDTITLSDYNWNSLNNTLDVKGDANFEGDVRIKGKSLVDSLEKIEEKLAILRPNEAMEEKWEKLRELRRQYMELEAEIIEKEKIWDILKK